MCLGQPEPPSQNPSTLNTSNTSLPVITCVCSKYIFYNTINCILFKLLSYIYARQVYWRTLQNCNLNAFNKILYFYNNLFASYIFRLTACGETTRVKISMARFILTPVLQQRPLALKYRIYNLEFTI